MGSSGQKRHALTNVVLHSASISDSYVTFKGAVSSSDSMKLAKVLLFSGRREAEHPLFSGNYEIEFFSDTGVIAIVDSVLYNYPPLSEFFPSNFFKEKEFEVNIRRSKLTYAGKYRIRVCFYLSKFATDAADVYSNWVYFNLDVPPILQLAKTIPEINRMLNTTLNSFSQITPQAIGKMGDGQYPAQIEIYPVNDPNWWQN